MRSTDSDRSVRATPKKARDASPPPQDDLWVVVKTLVQQVAAQQAEWMLCATLLLSSRRQQPTWRKSLATWQTVATKPNPTTTTATTTTTTTTGQPSKDTRFADAVKRRPTHQQLVERQPEFRKAGAAAWLALKRETSVPAHSAPKWSSPRVSESFMQADFHTQSLATFERQCRVPASVQAQYEIFAGYPVSLDTTIVKSFKAWIPRSEAADKDKLAAICRLPAKLFTTIQHSPDVKARNFFRSTARIYCISTLEIVPKESLSVKTATEKEPAAPAVDPPFEMAAEITPAIQDDGAYSYSHPYR
ncbi:hypothetical protein BASA83_002946 [Batrachochytrium salamandrivorans]|nr:hypothetical protein BASA83_002946 [Batrachochytrium salamandrivorans]